MGIKGDTFKDTLLAKKADKIGKEIAIRELCRTLNCSVSELFKEDYEFSFRQLYALHVTKAYDLKRSQMREAALHK